jgi:hypothetical protein
VIRVLDDGRVALTWQDSGGKVRLLDHVPQGDHAEYSGVGDITRVSDTVAKLHGFKADPGTFTLRHVKLLCQLLSSMGYDTLYIERLVGHAMPMAVPIEGGDFDGWWRLDLEHARSKLRLDRTANACNR